MTWRSAYNFHLCGPRPASGPDGLAVTLNGEANAVGDNTFADTKLYSRAFDRGAVQFAFGSAVISASALSQAGNIAYAAANSFVDIAGADWSTSSTVKAIGGAFDGDPSWSREISSTSFAAFNVVGWDFSESPYSFYEEGQICQPDQLQGNLASFNIDAAAHGDNTYVNVDNMSLATEGLSTNTSFSTVGVGVSGPTAAPILKGCCNDVITTKQLDTYVDAGGGNDRVVAGNGDDWILGGCGKDNINGGQGNNTVFAGSGTDTVTTRNGDDWVFGGTGKDTLQVGNGNNIVYAGDGNDIVRCGTGDDVVYGGRGNDAIDAGSGSNTIVMGTGCHISDGNDNIKTGAGDDMFFLSGNFGRDTIKSFVVSQGDRLVIEDDFWGYNADLHGLDDGSISLTRASFDKRDLVITLSNDHATSSLTLDNFFQLNSQYANPNSRVPLTDAQVATILHDILLDGSQDPGAQQRAEYIAVGDFLSFLG